MKKFVLGTLIACAPVCSKADMWGADLPLLAEIVFNTLHTMIELEQQTSYMRDEMEGVRDKINRLQTISRLVQPSDWSEWRDPNESLRRLRQIYSNLPKEYRSSRSDLIEREISNALSMAGNAHVESQNTFKSGKELERRGADASPAVAQKLTASGVGSLIAIESQTQAIQSRIMSLLAQSLAEVNERESRKVLTRGTSFRSLSTNLNSGRQTFSSLVFGRQNSEVNP